jgi:hypothetical protein
MREHLANCYQLIVASEPLLAQAIGTLRDDGWEAELKAFFVKHLADEKDHAKWLLEDLDGYTGNLHYGVAAMAGMAYYLILHVHPVALLGYMQALEDQPISLEFVEAIERQFGKKLARTLRLHAEEDPKHAVELEQAKSFVPSEWLPLVDNTRKQIRMYATSIIRGQSTPEHLH